MLFLHGVSCIFLGRLYGLHDLFTFVYTQRHQFRILIFTWLLVYVLFGESVIDLPLPEEKLALPVAE